MYAKSSPGQAYHLLTQEHDQTLCGLSVVPIIIDRPVSAAELHLTTEEPPGAKICEECVKTADDFTDVQ